MNDERLRGLAATYATPLYVLDERALRERIAYLRAALPDGVGLCYAVKANTFVLPALAGLVDRFEVCSPGERRICDEVGLPAANLVISGVYKSPKTVEETLASGELPAAITAESTAQLDLIERAAEARGARVSVLLRLTSGNQFGLDRAELIAAVRRLRDDARVELAGLQFFSGTQKTSLKRIGHELDRLDRLIAELDETCSWCPPELEYGPGLPVSYFQHDDFDEDAYLGELSSMLRGMSFGGRITIEAGRSLVASCGTYLTRVVDIKDNAHQRYALVDGGINHLVYYGQSMAMRQPRVRLLAQGAPARRSEELPWNICGSLCTTNDILAKQLPLRGLAIGSVLAFEMAGAYCTTEGMSLFLSHDLPGVVSVRNELDEVLVRAGTRTDTLNTPDPARAARGPHEA